MRKTSRKVASARGAKKSREQGMSHMRLILLELLETPRLHEIAKSTRNIAFFDNTKNSCAGHPFDCHCVKRLLAVSDGSH